MDETRWLRASAGDLNQVARGLAQDGFSKVAPAGVAGAKDEHEGLRHVGNQQQPEPGLQVEGTQNSGARQSALVAPSKKTN